jgi:hypothetical protein
VENLTTNDIGRCDKMVEVTIIDASVIEAKQGLSYKKITALRLKTLTRHGLLKWVLMANVKALGL